jgi:hypothetical protein
MEKIYKSTIYVESKGKNDFPIIEFVYNSRTQRIEIRTWDETLSYTEAQGIALMDKIKSEIFSISYEIENEQRFRKSDEKEDEPCQKEE